MLDNLAKDELREADQIQFDIFMGETTEQEAKQRYKIDSLDSANWALRKLKVIQEKETEIKQLAERELERIKNWLKTETDALKASTDFFEGLLMEYFVVEKEKDPKFKISTPYRKVSSRKQQDKWNYEDDKALKWLKENDKELVRIKEEINKTEIKKKYKAINGQVVTEYGEIVEGIRVEEQPDSIIIKAVE